MKKHPRKTHTKAIEVAAHDFSHRDKNHFWYIGVGILLLAFLMLTYSARDYLLMGVVVTAAVAVFRLANLKPAKRSITISGSGIRWGEQMFGYHHFRAFWVGTHGDDFTVYLDRLNFKPTISFVVEEDHLESVLEALIKELPFHDHRDTPLPDRFSRLLGL